MSRKDELLEAITVNKEIVTPLIDDILYMEKQLLYYRSLPQINVNPNNPVQQKATPAAKLYKETLQQYTNCIKVIAACTGQDLNNDVSPLRKWAAKYVNTE